MEDDSGDHHRKQRKMLNPVFSINHMRRMIPIFNDVSRKVRASRDMPHVLNLTPSALAPERRRKLRSLSRRPRRSRHAFMDEQDCARAHRSSWSWTLVRPPRLGLT